MFVAWRAASCALSALYVVGASQPLGSGRQQPLQDHPLARSNMTALESFDCCVLRLVCAAVEVASPLSDLFEQRAMAGAMPELAGQHLVGSHRDERIVLVSIVFARNRSRTQMNKLMHPSGSQSWTVACRPVPVRCAPSLSVSKVATEMNDSSALCKQALCKTRCCGRDDRAIFKA